MDRNSGIFGSCSLVVICNRRMIDEYHIDRNVGLGAGRRRVTYLVGKAIRPMKVLVGRVSHPSSQVVNGSSPICSPGYNRD